VIRICMLTLGLKGLQKMYVLSIENYFFELAVVKVNANVEKSFFNIFICNVFRNI